VTRRMIAPALALCTAAAVLTGVGSTGGASAVPVRAAAAAPAEPAVSPLRLTAPSRVTGYASEGRVAFEPGLRLVAQGSPFELWSQRPAYRQRIRTEWRGSGGTVLLPEGIQSDFRGLPDFLRMTVRNRAGERVARIDESVCLNAWSSSRVDPDAPLRSPYPRSCPRNRFTLGSVQGIQEGWATRLELYTRTRLAAGTYTVRAAIPLRWRELFGISKRDGVRTFTLVAGKGELYRPAARRPGTDAEQPAPAGPEPVVAQAGEPSDVMPDLRSLPAFGIAIGRSGDHLAFSANVWNAGSSPLVVEGFRREGEDVMDAYQYFVDTDGEQTGHQLVGTMEWDHKDSHSHWHFRDFARYRLLDADRTSVVRSRKEAFCLANTDAVDYTVPGADWQPDGTDLHSACGERDSISIREVLSAGSGDTYAQYRAGQSFTLKGLPNGVYYISVEANPKQRLVESSTTNNVRLRKVTLGGRPGARTVEVGRIRMP
jgi:hypothetical protein